MKFINTLSLTASVNDWLANSRHLHFLHVFDHACNLINEHREVLSIVTQQIGNGPFNLVLEREILFSNHLNIQSLISIDSMQLHLRDLTINTDKAELWSPRPDWEILHEKRENIFNQLISLLLPDYQPQLPDSLLTAFSAALACADLSSSRTAAKKLAGLGVGLTPAGDDFIMGATYASWIIHPTEIASTLAKEISNAAAPLTTSLSAAWLKSAGRGDAGILWHNFLDALILSDVRKAQVTMSKILSAGETSGADAMAGFFSTCISYMETEAKSCPS